MRVLVCGGRDFVDQGAVYTKLDALHLEKGITLIINGGARGADTLARLWAKSRNVACVTIPADWELYGRNAGPIRNKQMIREQHPEFVVAFPGGRGTAHMVKIAREAKLPVDEIKE